MERPRSPSVASERPDGMAVSAHKLTLRDLAQDLVLCPPDPRATDIADLLEPGQVIPLHHLGVEHMAAISAWSAGLETAEPGAARHGVDRSRLWRNTPADLSLIHCVAHFCGTLPAIDLQSVEIPCASIEGRARFHDGAP